MKQDLINTVMLLQRCCQVCSCIWRPKMLPASSRVCRTCHKSCGTYFHVCCLLQWLSLFSYSSINCSLSTKCWVPQTVHIQISGSRPTDTDTPAKQPSTLLRTLHLVLNVFVYKPLKYYGQTAVAGSNTLEWLHCVPHGDTCIQ